MLAKTFLDSNQLGISLEQRDALILTLDAMESGKLVHVPMDEPCKVRIISYCVDDEDRDFTGGFNMDFWSISTKQCGTICCIGGAAEFLGGISFSNDTRGFPSRDGIPETLRDLFFPDNDASVAVDMRAITVEQAAQALRNYLTLGKADWADVLA